MRLTFLEGSHGTFETIGPSTLGKWRLHFEKPAQNHTTTISSFAATIMSTNGKNAMKISAGRYCSERAAMNSTLSREPEGHEQDDHRDDRRRRDEAVIRAERLVDPVRMNARQHERDDQRGE